MPGDILADDEIETMLARANAATPGPWEAKRGPLIVVCPPSERENAESLSVAAPGIKYGVVPQGIVHKSDAEFIAHARDDVPKLVAEVRRLQAELAKLREHNDHIKRVLEMIPKEVVTESIYQAMQAVLRRHGGGSDG